MSARRDEEDGSSAPPAWLKGVLCPPVLGILLLCCGVELSLMAADAGLIGSRLWRGAAYQNGAFWAGLLHNWRPNYTLQPYVMFLSYAFLHADLWHLVGNMLALVLLARIVLARVGPAGFFCLYVVSALGGALVFGVLSASAAPKSSSTPSVDSPTPSRKAKAFASRSPTPASRCPMVRTSPSSTKPAMAMKSWSSSSSGRTKTRRPPGSP